MDERLIASLRQGDMQALEQLYTRYRPDFLAMIKKKYNVPHEDALDIYQVASLRMFDNVVSGKMEMLNESVRPYLFAIGINVYREMKREESKRPRAVDPLEWIAAQDNSEVEKQEALQKESLLEASRKAVEKLEEPCRTMLTRFYYYKASMRQLMEEFGYKNEASAKNKKYKCLQQLRELLGREKLELNIA